MKPSLLDVFPSSPVSYYLQSSNTVKDPLELRKESGIFKLSLQVTTHWKFHLQWSRSMKCADKLHTNDSCHMKQKA